jgi:hypothetical protein
LLRTRVEGKELVGFHKRLPGTYPHDAQLDYFGIAENTRTGKKRYSISSSREVPAKLDVWMGMPHGFVTDVGRFSAATQALSAIGAFLTERLGRTLQ